MNDYTCEQSVAFETAYRQLKKARADEQYLARHRDQILGAEADGVSDSDLIAALKSAYPDIQVTRHTIKKLREKWKAELDLVTDVTSGN